MGSIGVPIFFIISGFIMFYSTKNIENNGLEDTKKFYLKRLIRIIPLYFFLTFCWMLMSGISNYTSGEGLERFIKSILFIPDDKTPPVLFLGWSLNYEMFFYLIFGITLLFKTTRYYVFSAFVTSIHYIFKHH